MALPEKEGMLDGALWRQCRALRKNQKRLGGICALLLLTALLGMFDGLQGVMRSGASMLDLLPGGSAALSGPLSIKNPVHSDLQTRFSPDGAPCSFHLEGFFAGYWFGNGMWRGTVLADNGAEPGEYSLRASFRGAPASTAQHYTIRLYADAQALRAASTFFLLRLTGVNPFVLAGACVILAILLGVGVYRLGSSHIHNVLALGCGEVIRASAVDGVCRIWCLLYGARAPAEGTLCPVLDAEGISLGRARAERVDKGTLELLLPCAETAGIVRPGFLVLLRSPRLQSPPAG